MLLFNVTKIYVKYKYDYDMKNAIKYYGEEMKKKKKKKENYLLGVDGPPN